MTVTAFLEPQGKSAVALLGSEARSSPFAYCIYRSEGDQNLRKKKYETSNACATASLQEHSF